MNPIVSGCWRASVVGAELLLIALLAVAVGMAVSQAAAKCDTAFDCSHSCSNVGTGSRKQNELQRRFTTGTRAAVCGEILFYNVLNCAGDPAREAGTTCPDNCCK